VTSLRILILKTGTTDAEVVSLYGDYDRWFCEVFSDQECTVIRPYLNEPLPDPTGFDGVVLTGSPLSVRDDAPWMKPLGRWSVAAADQGIPVLAVCFGHQLVGEALGGLVEENPAGREIGTVTVALTDRGIDDPLFSGLPAYLTIQATHRDVLVRAPQLESVHRLAGNANTPWQAFAYGDCLRAVQFHPELSAVALRRLLTNRGQEGWHVVESSEGRRILRNWVTHYVADQPGENVKG
jgi:GMP synthase (glutamine-hydrolysing)